jgi:hypothetical protein
LPSRQAGEAIHGGSGSPHGQIGSMGDPHGGVSGGGRGAAIVCSLHDLAPHFAAGEALRNPVGKNQNEKGQRQNPKKGTAHEGNMGKGRANPLAALASRV